MRVQLIRKRIVNFIIILVTALSTGSLAQAQNPAPGMLLDEFPQEPVVVQLLYKNTENLNQLASYLDIWEVDHNTRYLVAMLTPEQYISLKQAGYQITIDQAKTDLITQPRFPLPDQGIDTIPGYPCYRTVEETYASMGSIIDSHPGLSELFDLGDSWDKVAPGGSTGYDIRALRLSNENFGDPDEKPTMFLMAEIHAREYVTAETALRFAEYLSDNYGLDPDITWLLDYFRLYIVTMANPDGRKFAEQGLYWRKNTDSSSGNSCSFPPFSYGIDLNRNHGFHWGGASSDPCAETYQGPTYASEPETQAIQNFILTLFPDQRGSADTDPAPLNATGIFITLHSYGQLVLWPWGWTDTQAPNNLQLQTLGRHLAFFNHSTPEQSNSLYPTSGSSDDWSYGELGIASFTFEMGGEFFESCPSFQDSIYPGNREALLYALKSARQPNLDPAGPDTYNVVTTPNMATSGTSIILTATADDTRYMGGELVQNISAARYSIDNPSWIPDVVTYPLTASDGSYDQNIEAINATLDTSGLSVGRHTIFVESMDANGNWGVTGSAFLTILPPVIASVDLTQVTSDPIFRGTWVQFNADLTPDTEDMPYDFTVDFGDTIMSGQATNEPLVINHAYSFPGSYNVEIRVQNAGMIDPVSDVINVKVLTRIFLPLSIK